MLDITRKEKQETTQKAEWEKLLVLYRCSLDKNEKGNIMRRNKRITHQRHFSVIPEKKTRAAEHVIVIASKSKSEAGICSRYWRRTLKKKDAATETRSGGIDPGFLKGIYRHRCP
jgi:hypothetical protein